MGFRLRGPVLPIPVQMILLALESSCDETGVAVIQDGRIRSNAISSQIRLHADYGGVVPELAAREHLRNLIPVTRTALHQARVDPRQLDGIAATRGPGLPSALMIGFKTAQTMAFLLRKPLIGIHHHEAHLYSPWIVGNPPHADFDAFEANVALIVSGGHTMLVQVEAEGRHRLLGATLDDAAGECFDKTGKLMGLPYPAGPEIDRLAEAGNPRAFDFPRPMINDPNDDFSFSGLKTSVRYFLRDRPDLLNSRSSVQDLCASIQAAIVDVLLTKTLKAARRCRVRCVTASGGVIGNRALRRGLAAACDRAGLKLRLADPAFCTDNAAMIGILAERKLLHGIADSSLDEDVLPGWQLDEIPGSVTDPRPVTPA